MRYKKYTLADLKESASRKKFNVVSFFAGGGGSSCGYKLAGGDVLCVNEFQQAKQLEKKLVKLKLIF